MREYLAGYRDAIEKVFELQKDKAGFPTLKQALLEDYFKKSAEPDTIVEEAEKLYSQRMTKLNQRNDMYSSQSLALPLTRVSLTGTDDSPMLESREL